MKNHGGQGRSHETYAKVSTSDDEHRRKGHSLIRQQKT
jgi:hypothetical protein